MLWANFSMGIEGGGGRGGGCPGIHCSSTLAKAREVLVSNKLWKHKDGKSSCSCTYYLESVVRGHHMYKRIWTPVVREQLVRKYEEDNDNDSGVVAS